ncbi:hypothetical protein SDC9_115601 [bioreactor metagenome]|uniref:Uncharacterized protein n=1 Tax=bioreactor metagenome TaxID=1076179 RepID=A0A645BTX9_9ZZZZ
MAVALVAAKDPPFHRRTAGAKQGGGFNSALNGLRRHNDFKHGADVIISKGPIIELAPFGGEERRHLGLVVAWKRGCRPNFSGFGLHEDDGAGAAWPALLHDFLHACINCEQNAPRLVVIALNEPALTLRQGVACGCALEGGVDLAAHAGKVVGIRGLDALDDVDGQGFCHLGDPLHNRKPGCCDVGPAQLHPKGSGARKPLLGLIPGHSGVDAQHAQGQGLIVAKRGLDKGSAVPGLVV